MPRDGKRIKGSACERAQARERMRTDLLTAARTLAGETGGYDQVTVRSVANHVGYAVPVVYQYFDSKRALLLELVDVGFTELAQALGLAHCPSESTHPDNPLLAIAVAYWDFAVADPHLYRLMHSLPEIPFGTPAAPKSARRCFEILRETVTLTRPDLIHDLDGATDLLWAQLHGLVDLVLADRIKGGAERGRTLLVDLTQWFAEAPTPPSPHPNR